MTEAPELQSGRSFIAQKYADNGSKRKKKREIKVEWEKTNPVSPWTVSSIGNTWIRRPYTMFGAAAILKKNNIDQK